MNLINVITRGVFKIIILLIFTQTGIAASLNTEQWTTPQGAQVIFHPSMEVPMLDIIVAFTAGSAYDNQQEGISSLTTHLINQGNGGLNATTIANQLAQTGAQFGAQNNQNLIALSLKTLTDTKALHDALQTFALIINKPDFPIDAFNHEKNQQFMAISRAKESPEIIANNMLYQALYQDHPYAHPIDGQLNTIGALHVEDVQAFYKRYFIAKNAYIVIVGAVDSPTAHTIAEQLTRNLPKGNPAPPIPQAQPLTEDISIEVKYTSSQTIIRLAQLGISHQNPDFFPLQVGNYILGGGSFESRLGIELRHKRGLTYGVNSQFVPMPGIGPFIIGFSTRNDQALNAVNLTRKTLEDFVQFGPTEQELIATKQHLTGSFPLSLASNRNIAEFLLKIAYYHLPDDYLTQYTQHVNAVTTKDIKRAFQRLIHPDKLLQLSVGKI